MNALSRMARSLLSARSGRNRPMQTGHALRTRAQSAAICRKLFLDTTAESLPRALRRVPARFGIAMDWAIDEQTARSPPCATARPASTPLPRRHHRRWRPRIRACRGPAVREGRRAVSRAMAFPRSIVRVPAQRSGLVLPAHVPGVRVLSAQDRRIALERAPTPALRSGQAVLTELRKVSEPAAEPCGSRYTPPQESAP